MCERVTARVTVCVCKKQRKRERVNERERERERGNDTTFVCLFLYRYVCKCIANILIKTLYVLPVLSPVGVAVSVVALSEREAIASLAI